MNALESRLNTLDPGLLSKFYETREVVNLLLSKYDSNFPSYTDHSITHSLEVFKILSELLTAKEILNLNADEIYILSMASILHDIGMCLPVSDLINTYNKKFNKTDQLIDGIEDNSLIRDIHHEFSYEFILEEQETLKIPNEKYAEAIGLVAKGHRKVALDDNDTYKPKFFVKSGREFVCLPYLASLLRLADELDITNIRTPKLLTKYYMPNNEESIKEWKKHIATTQINYTEDKILFEVKCTDQNTLAALEEQFEKIQSQANYCQKIIRTIANTEDRTFSLNAYKISPIYQFIGFDPKGIKFSFNVNNVVKTFIGEDLYEDQLVSIREALQNAIDSCRYKRNIYKNDYSPEIKVVIEQDSIKIEDNGLGMDDFIIENFFGRLGSSFYEQEKVKSEFEAIGQFGVGIFSYFLLGEFIDIETKTQKGETLKFRIDKDPKNYFHFFEETQRKSTGTTITLNLKPDIQDKYNSTDYHNYIRHTFRHVEFPITVIDGGVTYDISTIPFNIIDKEIPQYIKLKNKHITNKFTLIKQSIIHEDFEGECALIVKKITKKDLILDAPKYFEYDSFSTVDYMHDQSQISISQKGVYVNNYSSGYLTLMIGDVNFKKGHKININRKEFTHSKSVSNVIGVFISNLIKKYLSELRANHTDDEFAKISNSFIEYYLSSYFPEESKNELKLALDDNILLTCFIDNKDELLTFKDIEERFTSFVVASILEDKHEIQKRTNLPVVLTTVYGETGTYQTIYYIFRKLYNFTPKSIICEDKVVQILYKGDYDSYKSTNLVFRDLSIYRINDVQSVDSQYVSIKISKNKKELTSTGMYYSDQIINKEHPFIKFIIKNHQIIKGNTEFEKIIKSSIELIREINDGKRIVLKKIKELNQIIKPLNNIEEVCVFKTDDFQPTIK